MIDVSGCTFVNVSCRIYIFRVQFVANTGVSATRVNRFTNILPFRFWSAGAKRTTAARAFAKLLAFLGSHLFPAFRHTMAPAPAVPRSAEAAPSSEEQPAQAEQSDCLPKSDRVQTKEGRHHP